MASLETYSWRRLLPSVVIASALAVTGCGSDGADGAAGPAGPAGPNIIVKSEIPTTLVTSIDSAAVAADGALTVSFSLKDDQGNAYVGLAAEDIRFAVAQLIPAGVDGDGEPGRWQSYINKSEGPGVGPGTLTTIQATSETASGTSVADDDGFTDNGDGTYSFTLAHNLKNISIANGKVLDVAYDAALIHRVAFQLGRSYPASNPTLDWKPSGEAIDPESEERKIVAKDACNSCHGSLALHGSGRVETDYCVTCHNPGSTDANSTNTLDFKVMVHKIHNGSKSPTFVAALDQWDIDNPTPAEGEREAAIEDLGYTIYGYKDGKHSYGHVVFPQDIRNCLTCHNESNPETPQAKNWRLQPSIEACGSCHDDVDFATGTNHGLDGHPNEGPKTNADCLECHDDGAQQDIRLVHDLTGKDTARDDFVMLIDGVSLASNATPSLTDLTITVTFEDGSGAPVTGAAGDLDYIYGNDPKLLYNWIRPREGYQTNYMQNFSGLDTSSTAIHMGTAPDAGNNALGQHIYVVEGLDLQAGDSILVTNEILLCVDRLAVELMDCGDDDAEVKAANAVTSYFDSSGTLLVTPPVTFGADRELCNSCHKDLNAHPVPYNHGATEFDQCRSCHNGNRMAFESLEVTDLKSIVHRFHSAQFHQVPDDGEIFPDDVNNCTQCHSGTQYDLPIQANKWAETGPAGSTSSTVVVCSSCHLESGLPAVNVADLSNLTAADQALVDHMDANGGVFNGTVSAANKVESCAICHAIGEAAGVDVVHGIQ